MTREEHEARLRETMAEAERVVRETPPHPEYGACTMTCAHNMAYVAAAAEAAPSLLAALDEARRERDAYKRAKAENDERFTRERDEARASRDDLLVTLGARERQLAAAAKETKNARRGSEMYRADRDYHLNRAIEATKERDEARALKVPPTVEALLAAQMDAATARAALPAARAAAIEECAKVLDARAQHWKLHAHSTGCASSSLHADEAMRTAARLRALASETGS